MSDYNVRLEVGKNDTTGWFGDVVLGSFASKRTALEMGAVVANALTDHTGAGVSVDVVKGDRLQLHSESEPVVGTTKLTVIDRLREVIPGHANVADLPRGTWIATWSTPRGIWVITVHTVTFRITLNGPSTRVEFNSDEVEMAITVLKAFDAVVLEDS